MNPVDKHPAVSQAYHFCVGVTLGVIALISLQVLLYTAGNITIFLATILVPPSSTWHTTGYLGIWSTFLAAAMGGPFMAVLPFPKQSILMGGEDKSVFKIRTRASSIGERYPMERAGFAATLLVVAIVSAVILGQGVDLHH